MEGKIVQKLECRPPTGMNKQVIFCSRIFGKQFFSVSGDLTYLKLKLETMKKASVP